MSNKRFFQRITSIGFFIFILCSTAASFGRGVKENKTPGRIMKTDRIETGWQRYIKPNLAYMEAKARRNFSMTDPAGFVRSERERQLQRDRADKLRKAIFLAYKNGKKKFTVPVGEYRFSKNRGLSFNHLNDFTIIAYKARFWFERSLSQLAADPKGLELNGCRNVAIKGLTIDFDPPVYLQAKILRIDEKNPGFVVEIDKDFPEAEMGNGNYFLYRADGKWIQHGYLFHKGIRRIEGRKYRVLLENGDVFKVHNHDSDLLKYTKGRCRIGKGDYIVLPFRRGKGIFVHDCESCLLEDVEENASPGMGILEVDGKGGNIYRRVKIIPPEGTRRLHVCAADGFHNARTDRGPQLIECEITGTSDDFFNLHGHFGVVWYRLDNRQYIMGQANLQKLKPGDKLTFYNHLTLDCFGDAFIVDIKPLTNRDLVKKCNSITLQRNANRNYYRITLDRELPLYTGALVDINRFRSSGFLIKNCYFHDAMARSLINGAGDGSLLGNIIERSAWPLVIHFETWCYYEGPINRNITIRGNVIRAVRGPHPGGGILVTMVPADGGYLRKTSPISNINITGNYIEDAGGFAITLTNTNTGTIENNIIVHPMQLISYGERGDKLIQGSIGHPNYFRGKAKRAAISLWSCRNIEVRNNLVIDPDIYCRYGQVQIDDLSKNIHVSK